MLKHKKLVFGFLIIVLLLLALHFIPFDNRTGYTSIQAFDTCDASTGPTTLTYRWITGGVNDWDKQLSFMSSKKPAGCYETTHTKLYLF